MAFWSKKKIKDIIIKYLHEQNSTTKEEDNAISFEVYFEKGGYSVYPYINLDEITEEINVVINLNKLEDNPNLKTMVRLNEFNQRSKFFCAKINENNIVYLEYNSFCGTENIGETFPKLIDSLFSLQEEIDLL